MTLENILYISYIWMGIAIPVHITMFFVTAPFGRHTTTKWGVSINNKLGWILMEMPSLGLMLYFLFNGTYSLSNYSWVLFLLWILHYTNRTLIYPFRIKSTPKKMPLLIVVNAIVFNFMNAGLNGYFLAELSNGLYTQTWLSSFHFYVGLFFFLAGAFINLKSDSILIRLRKPGETGYKIPLGFLFKYISSPNLLGEIIEWTGFAIMARNVPALSFAVWTYANLVPRAKNHHDWYKRNFDDYPEERKVVFPFIF